MGSRKTEHLEVAGKRYRRYQGSELRQHRVYWQRRIKTGIAYLHRDIWESINGKIPEGFHVHHKNGDTDDNTLGNLLIIHGDEHSSIHMTERMNLPEAKDLARQNMKKAMPKIIRWRKSASGRAHYKKLGETLWKSAVERSLQCDNCGAAFKTFKRTRARFCGNRCKSDHRRKSKVDMSQRICAMCNKEFSCNMYSTQESCSRVCGQAKRRGLKGK